MIIHRIPKRLKGIIFDMDGTLYDNPAYMEHQVETQVRRWAETRGMAYEAAKAELEAWMEAERQRTGAKTSLGNALAAHGVDIATSVAWRAELIKPEAWLKPDPALRAVLAKLAKRYALAILTNNPASVGRAAARALGIEDLFQGFVGLDTTLRSKPRPEPFIAVLDALKLPAEGCLSVGDRYDVDIAPALALGIGGVELASSSEISLLQELL